MDNPFKIFCNLKKRQKVILNYKFENQNLFHKKYNTKSIGNPLLVNAYFFPFFFLAPALPLVWAACCWASTAAGTKKKKKYCNQVSNKTGFILYALRQPFTKQSRKIFNYNLNLIKFLLSTLGLIASIKNIEQNIRENIVKCWIYEIKIKILRLISKPPSHTSANFTGKSFFSSSNSKTFLFLQFLS